MSTPGFARTLVRGALAASVATLAACGGTSGGAPPRTAMNDAATPAAQLPANAPVVDVYKSPTCGCCNNWVKHMQENGFRVVTHDTANVDPVKDADGVPKSARSCHTGHVGGYVIEGHVPADLVKKLLHDHPAGIAGLAVPGMVAGSPGMEGPYPEHYDVLAFTRDGKTSVYASR